MSTLRYVSDISEIRKCLVSFNTSAQSNQGRSRKILRQTTYWVFDEQTKKFGPSKFIGFSNMTIRSYDAATKGNWAGNRFDGHATRVAIENVTGLTFRPDPSLTHRLVKWGERLLMPGALDGIDDSKWRFLRI